MRLVEDESEAAAAVRRPEDGPRFDQLHDMGVLEVLVARNGHNARNGVPAANDGDLASGLPPVLRLEGVPFISGDDLARTVGKDIDFLGQGDPAIARTGRIIV